MKRPGLTPHFLSATLFLVAIGGPAVLAQEKMSSPARGMSARGDELLKRFDKNGDGKLDDDERFDAKEVMMQDQINRQMPRASVPPDAAGRFRVLAIEFFDRNRDGRLDETEWQEARTTITQWMNAPAPITAPASATAAAPEKKRTTAEEAARLERVAAEVARRRTLREQANGTKSTPSAATAPQTAPPK